MESCYRGSEKNDFFRYCIEKLLEGSGGFQRGSEVRKGFHHVPYSSMGHRGRPGHIGRGAPAPTRPMRVGRRNPKWEGVHLPWEASFLPWTPPLLGGGARASPPVLPHPYSGEGVQGLDTPNPSLLSLPISLHLDPSALGEVLSVFRCHYYHQAVVLVQISYTSSPSLSG